MMVKVTKMPNAMPMPNPMKMLYHSSYHSEVVGVVIAWAWACQSLTSYPVSKHNLFKNLIFFSCFLPVLSLDICCCVTQQHLTHEMNFGVASVTGDATKNTRPTRWSFTCAQSHNGMEIFSVAQAQIHFCWRWKSKKPEWCRIWQLKAKMDNGCLGLLISFI